MDWCTSERVVCSCWCVYVSVQSAREGELVACKCVDWHLRVLMHHRNLAQELVNNHQGSGWTRSFRLIIFAVHVLVAPAQAP